MFLIMVVFLILSIILCLVAGILLYKAYQIKVQKKHQQQDIDKLNQVFKQLLEQYNWKKRDLQLLNDEVIRRHDQAEKIYQVEIKAIKSRVEDFKKISDQAASHYIDGIEKDYEHAETAHKKQITKLQEEYNRAAAELNDIKETRKSAYEALLREKEIKADQDNYRLNPSRNDLEDIHTLEHIKDGLHKPRILSMLIWQTYWQPIAKKKFPLILQDKTKIGIYKITNTQTDESYIGQSVDVYKRWCEHCKAGVGIDTPPGNKLYRAMQDDGLENFTFELLCECPKENLNEKEKFFIELYQSDTFGYNSTSGNK